MNKILLGLLLLFSTSRAVDTLSIPTDFNTINSGTRANLSSNFTSIGTWAGKIRDTVAQVTGRVSGYSGTLLISSLSNLRLKLDADNSETARFLVESGAGDSLFRVSEDSTAKFFGPLSINSLTASQPVWTDAAKKLVSNAPTGTGTTLVLQTNPTLAGIIGGNLEWSGTAGFDQQITFAGNGVTGLSSLWRDATNGMNMRGIAGSSNQLELWDKNGAALLSFSNSSGAGTFPNSVSFSSATASTAAAFDASKNLVSVTNTGTGNNVLATSPTITTPIFSGTIASGLTASRTVITDGSGNFAVNTETGTGSHVRATSPTLVTPNIGAATGTSLNVSGNVAADSLVSSKFYEENTFTASASGFTAGVTGTARYVRVGKLVTLYLPGLAGTSNSTAFSITGSPSTIWPARLQFIPLSKGMVTDNSVSLSAWSPSLRFNTDGSIQVYQTQDGNTSASTLFTSSGAKGLSIVTVTYTLQ